MPVFSNFRPIRAGGVLAVLCVGATALVGCAAQPQPPAAELALAAAAIDDAERGGAVQYAPAELQQAREKLAGAQAATRDQDNRTARMLATEAELDAKLARITADTGQAQKSAFAVQQSNATLRLEATPTP